MKADLHNHLGSNGANPGFDETIDLVHNKLGHYSAFGIVNSDDSRYERFIEQRGKYDRQIIDGGRAVYVPKRGVLVVKCQEMFTKEGHILAIATPYGKNASYENARDAIKEAKDLGGILSAVHPYYREGIGNFLESNPELIEQFSSWEIYNGSAEFSFPKVLPKDSNLKSMFFYSNNILNNSRLNIGVSSFTDGHDVNVIGRCYTDIILGDNFMNENFVGNLDSALRAVKFSDRLHMEPNKMDAAIHTFDMVVATLKGLRK